MSRTLVIAFTAAAIWCAPALARTWTGKVVDIECARATGASNPECGSKAVKGGQPMGLLTDDGTLVLLVAQRGEAEAYEALRARFGHRVHVTGSLSERDGVKVNLP